MPTLTHTLNSIEQSVRLLKAKLERLERENSALSAQNKDLIVQNRALQTDLLMKESELSYVKTYLLAQEQEEPEVKERQEHLRKEIGQYVSPVNESIGWLQK